MKKEMVTRFITGTIEDLAEIIYYAECMRNSYFFRPPNTAAGRRYYESYRTHEEISWEEGGHIYTAETSCRCTCKNVYWRTFYTRDGKTTNLTAIRNSYNRMTKED